MVTEAHRFGRVGLALLGALLLGSCRTTPHDGVAPAPAIRETLRVLFIGNSYTFVNNLGDVVAGVSEADRGAPRIVPTLATRGGASLRWHLENGPALRRLQERPWDYVILQEQSLLGGRVADGRTTIGPPDEFFRSVRDWNSRIRAVGATPVLFMTWARRASTGESDRVQEQIAEAYRAIGRELDVRVAPVGLAWAEARRRLPTLDLHKADQSHPTSSGTYLAALVIFSTLTGRSPIGAPAVIRGRAIRQAGDDVLQADVAPDDAPRLLLVDLRDAIARELQEIAWAVVRQDRTSARTSRSGRPESRARTSRSG